MIRNFLYTSFIIILLVSITSCNEYALFNSGEKITEEFKLDTFTHIEVKDVFNLTLVSDTVDKLYITTGENLLQNISYTIKDKVLYLYDDNKFKWTREYNRVDLKLHTSQLKRIDVREPSTIVSEGTFVSDNISFVCWSMVNLIDMDVDVNTISINMGKSNSAEYRIRGKANRCYISAWGSSFIYTDQLVSNNVNVRQRSIGDVYVNSTDNLNVSIETSGNVYYSGNPTNLDVSGEGSGKLIQLSN